jgi:hypothetical protein
MIANEQGLNSTAFLHGSWPAIQSHALKNNMRVIDLHPFDTDKNLFSAVLLQHA